MEAVFEALVNALKTQQQTIKRISEKLELIESIGGGGGSASIEDYEPGKIYKRNVLVVDKNTETVYRVLPDEYLSVAFEEDLANGYLKLVGFESSIVTIEHDPVQAEIDAFPDDTLVAVYSPLDDPYLPST